MTKPQFRVGRGALLKELHEVQKAQRGCKAMIKVAKDPVHLDELEKQLDELETQRREVEYSLSVVNGNAGEGAKAKYNAVFARCFVATTKKRLKHENPKLLDEIIKDTLEAARAHLGYYQD